MAASMRSRSAKTQKRKLPKAESLSHTHPAEAAYEPWTPTTGTAFKALLSARLCAAIWSHITDCDETFNYWEPLHFLLHGKGFQTWEYSPVYAIRSYAYLWVHALPLKFYNIIFQADKILQFYFIRCLLAFCCSWCEIYFYRGACKQFGNHVGRLLLTFLIFAAGMFISCSALLPSSFAMYMTLTGIGGWMHGHIPVAIFSIGASAIVGWPFAGAIGIPIAYDLIIRKKELWDFFKWTALSAAFLLVVVVQIDSHYYGGVVIAPLNIVLYNVFSDHGPDLYGVAPLSFYFMNGFLNFNIVFLMALVALPFVVAASRLCRVSNRGIPAWLCMSSMYIWFLIFFTRPHKEERFLFPVYPLICLGAALTLDSLQNLYNRLISKRALVHYSSPSAWVAVAVSVVYIVLSISRSMALFYGYHAPMEVYGELYKMSENSSIHRLPPDKNVNVCVGKEWHRFPGSFFLPSDRWNLQFIKSEFKGQLPKPYAQGPDATKKIPSHMNDLNLEEPTRYIDISQCHYLVDLDVDKESKLEPRYSQQKDNWTTIASAKFLDASRSHPVFRAFYIPFLSEKYTTFIDYNVYKTTRTKRSGQQSPDS